MKTPIQQLQYLLTGLIFAMMSSLHSADFNADGKEDILFKKDDGSYIVQLMEGNIKAGQIYIMGDKGWSVESVADFDGNGYSDILFRQDDDSLRIQFFDDTGKANSLFLMGDQNWTVEGNGEFNDDNSSDILFRNADGSLIITYIDATGKTGQLFVSLDRNRTVEGLADFDGNGHSDILYKQSDGSRIIWYMDENGKISNFMVTGPALSTFYVRGLGDFNNDGQDDILFQKDDGTHIVWLMSASGRIGKIKVDITWKVLDVGDYNGDGFIDILFEKPDGSLYVTLMNQSGPISTVFIMSDKGWTVVGNDLYVNSIQEYTDESDQHINLYPPHDYNERRTLVGATKGTFGVHQGQANYKVDIVVPPGVNGLEPELSLNYSSNAGNGYLGLGWSLSGASVISRCAQTRAQDGDSFTPGINYTSTDKFCLDGKRLINTSGTYGANGTEYRTEVDTYAKITSYEGSTYYGPKYFKVKTKSGLIYTYGDNGNPNGVIANSININRYWKVTKIEDRFGNSIDFDYYVDKYRGIMYLTDIIYVDNTVKFEYEERIDDLEGYEAGYPYEINKRLSKVIVHTKNGTKHVRTYTLSYDDERYGSERSILSSITESTDAGNLETLYFHWIASSKKVNLDDDITNRNINEGYPGNTYFADFNGDGYMDIFRTELSVYLDCKVMINDQTNDFDSKNCNISSGISSLKFIDFDSDGDIDIYDCGSSISNKVWYNDGNGNFTVQSNPSSLPDEPANEMFFVDLNGDGLTDLLHYDQSRGKTYINNGNGTFTYKYTSYGLSGLGPEIKFSDFNADGAIDVYTYQNGSGEIEIWLNNGKGSFPSSASETLNLNYQYHEFGSGDILIADFNGDGIMDVYEGQRDNYDYLHINKGNAKFVYKERIINTEHQVKTADFNGDGLADIYEYGNEGFGIKAKLWINQGSGKLGSSRFDDETTHNFNNSSSDYSLYDFNGDGFIDIYEQRHIGDGNDRLWLNEKSLSSTIGGSHDDDMGPTNNIKPFITHIYNNKDENIHIYYTTLLNDSVHYNYRLHSRNIDNNKDNYEPAIPFYIVSSVKMANGLGGQDETSYVYKGYRINWYRGPLGFYEIYSYHYPTKERRYTQYKQEYPFIGMPELQTLDLDAREPCIASVCMANGKKVSEKEFSYDDQTYTENFQTIHQPYAKTIIEKKYDPTSEDLLLTKTDTKVLSDDQLGNIVNHTQEILDDQTGKTHKVVVVKQFNDEDTTSWLIGKVTDTETTKETVNVAITKKVTTEEFTYYPSTGALFMYKKLLEDNGHLLKTYTYTTKGNLYTETVEGTDLTALTTTHTYDPTHKFKATTSKTVGGVLFEEFFSYDHRFGELTSYTDPNGHTTSTTYNALGQKEAQTNPDDSEVNWYYSWGGATNALYAVTTIDDTKPYVSKYFDELDREVLYKTHTITGHTILQEKKYNSIGKLDKVSLPYIEGESKYYFSHAYDIYNRLEVLTKPSPSGSGDSTTTYSYTDFTTVETDGENHKKKIVKNALGQIIEVTDGFESSDASKATYKYDGLGNIIEVTDNANNITSYTFDNNGRKVSESDPDRGTRTYSRYDALDNLREESDARGTVKTYTYDALSRLKTVIATNSVEGLSKTVTHTYDTKPHGKGMPAYTITETTIGTVQSMTNVDYDYDSLSRLSEKSLTIDNETHEIEYTYDEFSREKGIYIQDASGVDFNTYYVYKNGYPFGIKNPYSKSTSTSTLGYIYYADQTDAWGNIINENFGNGVYSSKNYNSAGYIKDIDTLNTIQGSMVQTVGYDYDKVGNAVSRNTAFGETNYLNEIFTYDPLRRVESMVVSTNISSNTMETSKIYDYDKIGNIEQKGSIADYTYHSDKPHAVKTANGKNYTYDANGNMVTRGSESVSYTVFDKPYSMTNTGGQVTKFYYDGSNSKYKKITAEYETHYVGKYYERSLYTTASKNKYTGYFYFGDRLVGMKILQGTSFGKLYRFVHGDALNSVAVITDEEGEIAEQRSYEPFGEIRSLNFGNGMLPLNNTELTNRSFTNHEQIDEMDGLIHMGGRVYDSAVGRFLSANIHVPDSYSTQSYNRYSYGRNNPLGYIDPSGYSDIANQFGVSTVPTSMSSYQDTTPTYHTHESSLGVYNFLFGTDNSMKNTQYHSYTNPALYVTKSYHNDTFFLNIVGIILKEGGKVIPKIKKWFVKDDKKSDLKRIPEPDGGYSADLSKSKAKSRSGHRNAGNKQLHEDMKEDPKLKKAIEEKFGEDAFDRTSTSKGGRRNPKGVEWDHNSNDPNKLDLRSTDNHKQKTSIEGREGGGYKKFHKDK